MHYRITGSGSSSENTSQVSKVSQNENIAENIFGIKVLNNILPQHFCFNNQNNSQIITITGESGLYKSDLSINVALNTVIKGENALVIRLSDREKLDVWGFRPCVDILKKIHENDDAHIDFVDTEQKSDNPSKYALNKFECNLISRQNYT